MFIAIADFYRRSVQSCPEWKRTLLVTPLFYFSPLEQFFSRAASKIVLLTLIRSDVRSFCQLWISFINISFLINLTKLVDNLTFHRLDSFVVLLHIQIGTSTHQHSEWLVDSQYFMENIVQTCIIFKLFIVTIQLLAIFIILQRVCTNLDDFLVWSLKWSIDVSKVLG